MYFLHILYAFNPVLSKNIVRLKKAWHNRLFKDGGDTRQQDLLLRYAYYSTLFAERRFNSMQMVNYSRVLDVGSGRGISHAEFFVGTGCYYLGDDISEECITNV